MGKKFYEIKRLMLLVLMGSLLAGCSGTESKVTEMTDVVMGTILTQSIYGAEGEMTAQQVRDKLLAIEQEILSKRVSDAEIYIINQISRDLLQPSDSYSGQSDTDIQQSNPEAHRNVTVALSESLAGWMEEITALSKVSGGALDVTMGTVTALWNIDDWASSQDLQQYPLPAQNQIETALQLCGYEKMELESNILTLPGGMELDLGAVGKGIACDEAAKILLADDKITGAIISVGGSILTYGTKPDKTPWIVGIVNPRDTSSYLGRLTLQGQWCVATSGDYERYVEVDGVRYHHILDPATGYPADHQVISVTILSKSGLISDALSTACFVLGVERGLALAQGYGAEALIVDETGEIFMTDHMEDYFTRAME
jgi:thiamine biosynthesis lipoprotein